MKTFKLRYEPKKFINIENARASAERTGNWIILGDDEKYWTVCPSDFEKLIKAGYEGTK